MKCPHCNSLNSSLLPFVQPVEGGRAYAQLCGTCGHILGVRPRIESDPPSDPPDLTSSQIQRLRFMRWLFRSNSKDDGGDQGDQDSPLTAA